MGVLARLHILGDQVLRAKEAIDSFSMSRDCIKGVCGNFLRAAVTFPWSILSRFRVSYSGSPSFTRLGPPLKLCIKVSMVWSARAVVKNEPFGEYLLEWGVGSIFTLYWSGYTVFLIVGRFFMMYKGIVYVSFLLSKDSRLLVPMLAIQDNCIKISSSMGVLKHPG